MDFICHLTRGPWSVAEIILYRWEPCGSVEIMRLSRACAPGESTWVHWWGWETWSRLFPLRNIPEKWGCYKSLPESALLRCQSLLARPLLCGFSVWRSFSIQNFSQKNRGPCGYTRSVTVVICKCIHTKLMLRWWAGEYLARCDSSIMYLSFWVLSVNVLWP